MVHLNHEAAVQPLLAGPGVRYGEVAHGGGGDPQRAECGRLRLGVGDTAAVGAQGGIERLFVPLPPGGAVETTRGVRDAGAQGERPPGGVGLGSDRDPVKAPALAAAGAVDVVRGVARVVVAGWPADLTGRETREKGSRKEASRNRKTKIYL